MPRKSSERGAEGTALPELAEPGENGALAGDGGLPDPAPGPGDSLRGESPPEGGETEPQAQAGEPGSITIGAAEHVTVLGPSQSGKTYLVKQILRPLNSRIIIDPKHQDFGPEWGTVTADPEAILYEAQLVWQPDLRDVLHPDPKGQDAFSKGLQYIYDVRGDQGAALERRKPEPSVTVYFDEAYLTAPQGELNPWIPVLLASGMGRGIGVWASTQRGFKVHASFFSDAVHVVAFRLQNQLDLAKLRNELNAPTKEIQALDYAEHEFLYYRQGVGWTGPYQV
jgi:hypothetical protein